MGYENVWSNGSRLCSILPMVAWAPATARLIYGSLEISRSMNHLRGHNTYFSVVTKLVSHMLFGYQVIHLPCGLRPPPEGMVRDIDAVEGNIPGPS